MKAPMWVEFVCRKCSHHVVGDFVSTSHIPKRMLVKAAKNRGALFKHNEVFCSNECLDLFEKQDLKGPQP